MMKRKHLHTLLGHAVLMLLGIGFALPFAWLVSTSLKPDDQVFSERPIWIPTQQKTIRWNGKPRPVWRWNGKPGPELVEITQQGRYLWVSPLDGKKAPVRVERSRLAPVRRIAPVWSNYPRALTYVPFGRYVLNTLLIAITSVLGTLFSCSLVAYSFSRIRWPGRDLLFFILLSTLMLPGQVTMIPVFVIFKWLGWIGSIKPLVVPSFLGSAFFIFLLRQFFLTIPHELSDAGKIDGCSEWAIYWRIVLPLAKPALATVGIFTFMGAWNDFLGPLLYLNDERKYTLSLGLQQFVSQHGAEWAMLMAASTVMILPIILIFFLAQRTFIQGVTLTGIKG